MAVLSRAAIDAAEDRASETVAVPEWGGDVKVARMSASAHLSLGVASRSIPADRVMLEVLSLALVDDQGEPLFPGPEGVAALGRKNPDVVLRLYERAAAMNKLREQDVEAAAKN